MTGAEDIVFEISGRPHLKCYQDLCHAVAITHEQLPVQPSMKDLEAAVGTKLTPAKNAAAVSRALARAAEDAWENGGQAVLKEKYGFHSKPSPKKLILKLARAMEQPVEYQVWKEASSGKYGIIARDPNDARWLAVAPFLRDETQITAIVHILNQYHMSLEHFRELFFNDDFIKLLEGDFDQ